MFVIVGTVPDPDFPLVFAPVAVRGANLELDGRSVPVNRGTPALAGAAARVCSHLDLAPPVALLAGDTGLGHGSRKLYAHLVKHLDELKASTLVFHYLQPDVDWHNRVLMAAQECRDRPTLIADAGFMYAAKMSGFADAYDLFTPDMGELAFLADETAPHPFYTRGFILHDGNDARDLIARAYANGNGPRHMLVKGARDLFATDRGILWEVDAPAAEAMEAMGGTGDTLAGIAAALVHSGRSMESACRLAALTNRRAGELCRPTPATQVMELIAAIDRALETETGKQTRS
jgi:sugar/nucleoside kinase (ribokinase family)